MNNNLFTINFNTAELLCAATALGLATLPVQTDPPVTGVALQAEIRRGYESLQQRGLAQALGAARWQIDNLLAILTHWLAAPDSTLQLGVWQYDGERRQATLLFLQNEALWHMSEADTHYLALFQNRDDWVDHSINWLGSLPESSGEFALTMPPVNLVTFLPRLRQKPDDVELVLQRAGLSLTVARQTITRLATVTKAVTLTWQRESGVGQQIVRQAVVLYGLEGAWGGNVNAGEALVTLRPFAISDLAHLLHAETI